MRIDNPDEILKWDMQELWAAVQQINEEEENEYEEEIKKIKQGIKLKIPIYYIIEEWYDIYPDGQNINIYGYDKMNIHEFMDEKEERERLMRKIIYESIEDNDPLESR